MLWLCLLCFYESQFNKIFKITFKKTSLSSATIIGYTSTMSYLTILVFSVTPFSSYSTEK